MDRNKLEPRLIMARYVSPADEYAPWINWRQYAKRHLMNELIHRLEEEGFIEWEEEGYEDNPYLRNEKRMTARLTVLTKPKQDESKLDSNVLE